MAEQAPVALVTGGGTGIGRALVLKLAERGYRVGVNYRRSRGEAEAVVGEVRTRGGDAAPLGADVTQPDQVEAMVEQVTARWGRLDLLVNNAGKTTFVSFRDLDALTAELWQEALSINLLGVWHVSRAAARVMRRQGGGQIVNIGSVAGLTGQGSSIAYCAAKGAMLTLTRSLAHALAPQIRVNAVAPGFVKTRWHDGRDPAALARAAERTLLKRIGEPEDIAQAVLGLLDMEWMTGQILVVDGGVVV